MISLADHPQETVRQSHLSVQVSCVRACNRQIQTGQSFNFERRFSTDGFTVLAEVAHCCMLLGLEVGVERSVGRFLEEVAEVPPLQGVVLMVFVPSPKSGSYLAAAYYSPVVARRLGLVEDNSSTTACCSQNHQSLLMGLRQGWYECAPPTVDSIEHTRP